MDLKLLLLFGLVTCLKLNEALPQDRSSFGNQGTSASLFYYNNENQQTLCYFVDGQPLCGEEGQKARDADRERIKRLRDVSQPNFVVSNGGSQRDQRGDLASLPQGDSPFQDDGPVSHPRNTGANNYKGHVRPGNDKGHVRPTLPPPTTRRPTPPPTPRPTRPTRPTRPPRTTQRPCPTRPPTTTPLPCFTTPRPPRTTQRPCHQPTTTPLPCYRTTTQAPNPCYPSVTNPPPCQYASTEHPDIAEWRRTRNRNRRPSYQSDQNQPRSDFYRNRQAWISASTGMQNDGVPENQNLNTRRGESDYARGSSGQNIRGNSEGWWEVGEHENESRHAQKSSSRSSIFRSSRTLERDNQASSNIQEINVRRNGVILSVINDQPKRGLPQGQVNAHATSGGIENNGEFLRARFNHNKRRQMRLYQYFKKKADASKNNLH